MKIKEVIERVESYRYPTGSRAAGIEADARALAAEVRRLTAELAASQEKIGRLDK